MRAAGESVAYIVKTSKSKCKLKHCYELHYGDSNELCTTCDEESIVQEEIV
tara:strand:- start:391 stop:543 length:153 start_codon:yes stop_codon:yes gene_type:complete